MNAFLRLQPAARCYVAIIVTLGATVLVDSLNTLLRHPVDRQWLVLAALTLLTGSFSVKVPAITAYLSVSETFVFASVLLFGPSAATVTVLLEILVILFWMDPQARPVHRILFNMAAPAIAIWMAATAFYSFSNIAPYSQAIAIPPLATLFAPLLAFTLLYFLLNSWLVAIAVGLEGNTSPLLIWWDNFAWLSVNYFSGASVAALVVTYGHGFDASTLAVIVPLLVVSYLTFRTAMGRAEDSNSHLSELNRLYLSTIETLAMAIDAKDQITHGHIRRVQIYAVGLARHLGIVDKHLIRAIEAAALLHDMGKLAVPEHILNKPGKLTVAEFDKMKLHASVGADILSAIDFPYPVVPIVRHHHENWNGTGYPDGLRTTDIPIGARILSVVDCFDALTSDRPYRQRMSDLEALNILKARRGTMYDPLVVDAFGQIHAQISPAADSTALATPALDEIASSSHFTAPRLLGLQAPRQPDDDTPVFTRSSILATYDMLRSLSGHVSVHEIGEGVIKRLRHFVAFCDAILFVHDVSSDQLVVRYACGATAIGTLEWRLPLGQRLSGWVGANRRSIMNSDPALDFGPAVGSIGELRSCLSVPLVTADELVGVLTLYSDASDGFNDGHLQDLELISEQIAEAIKTSLALDVDTYLGGTRAHLRARAHFQSEVH